MTPPGTDNPAAKDTTEGALRADIDALLNDVAKSTERIENGLGKMPGVGTPLESDAETARLAAAVNGLLGETPASAKPEALTAIENLDAQLAELTAQLLDHSKPPPPPPVISDVEAAQAVVNQGTPPEAPVHPAAKTSVASAPSHVSSPPASQQEAEPVKPLETTPGPVPMTTSSPVATAPLQAPHAPAPTTPSPAAGPAQAPHAPTASVPASATPAPTPVAPTAPAALATPTTPTPAPTPAAQKIPPPPAHAAHAPPAHAPPAHVAVPPLGASPTAQQPSVSPAPAGEPVTTAESAALAAPLAAESGPPKLLSLMAAMSKPLEGKPRSTKSVVGLLGVFTIALGLFVWGFVIMRPPPKVTETMPYDLKADVLPRPVEPKAEEEKPAAKGGHDAPSSGHDAPKAKAKTPPKKEAAKKDAPKKAEHGEGGGH